MFLVRSIVSEGLGFEAAEWIEVLYKRTDVITQVACTLSSDSQETLASIGAVSAWLCASRWQLCAELHTTQPEPMKFGQPTPLRRIHGRYGVAAGLGLQGRSANRKRSCARWEGPNDRAWRCSWKHQRSEGGVIRSGRLSLEPTSSETRSVRKISHSGRSADVQPQSGHTSLACITVCLSHVCVCSRGGFPFKRMKRTHCIHFFNVASFFVLFVYIFCVLHITVHFFRQASVDCSDNVLKL